MTECKQAQQVSAYHDGELSGPSRIALEEHLRECPICAAELARLNRLSLLIRGAGRPEMPREALDRLHRSVDLQPRIAVLRMAEAFAAVAALILLLSSAWLWSLSTVREAAGQIPIWETVAVAPQDVSAAATQEQLARWIVQDLSRKNGND